MSPTAKRHLLWLSIFLIPIAAVFGWSAAPIVRAMQPNPLEESLQRARESGSYHFTSDIAQVTVPASKVTNVGRASRTSELHMEGQTNLKEASMQMRLWTQEGSVSDPSGGMAVKIEDGKTYVQEGQGAWKEREGLTDGFAPDGDFMAYLVALRDPVAHDPETINGISFIRYTFRLDGPALASYIRDEVDAEMRKRGDLPEGLITELPVYYRDMVGDGELWVGSDGLPLRQILRMQFPEQDDEYVRAQITTNFSGFGQAPGVSASLGTWIHQLPLSGMGPLLAVLIVVVFCTALISRRGRLWRGVAMVMIVLLPLNPLLSDLRIARATSVQAARVDEQKQQRQESRQQEEMRASLSVPQIDPHADPLAGAREAGSAAPAAKQPFTSAQPETTTQAPWMAVTCNEQPDPNDCDGDGLSNFDEETVGSDPFYSDTDEDGIDDLTEVMGFDYGGQHWYMDANATDSNYDGIEDGTEFDTVNNQPIDTDNDGIPDVFDPDNDGDGVQDGKDLSPFTVVSTVFSKSDPLDLTLNNLTPDMPVFVDFQVRPVNEDHLWFSYNMLDWPHDTQGHIQDVDDQTFGDLPRQGGDPTPNASSYYGDMKLVPMLEIMMEDGGTNLPAEEVLDPYNIRTRKMDDAGSMWAAYVPLTLITDSNTGERMAFGGRMYYKPNGNLTSDPPQPFMPIVHQVRLVWLVQMLMDIPCDPSKPEEVDKGCKADKYIHNDSKVIQVYYDDWKLTGLNLKEDHGAKTAVVYEVPPAGSTTLQRDAALTALAYGLEKSFLSARDQDGNGERDIDVDEIKRRFDSSDSIEVSEAERWNIPSDTLRVERNDYATIDEAVKRMGTETTPHILSTYFDAKWEEDNSLDPLLMYVQELSSRGVGLDGVSTGDGSVIVSGSGVVIDLHPAGQDPAPLLLLASLKWTPYCKNDDTGLQWSECELSQWWESLERRNPDLYPGDPPDDEQLAAGRTMSMILYETVIWQGVSQVVEINNTRVSVHIESVEDSEIAGYVHIGLSGTGSLVRFFVNVVAMAAFENPIIQEALTYDLGLIWQIIRRDVIRANINTLRGLFSAHLGLIIGCAIVLAAYFAFATYMGFQGDWNWAYGGIVVLAGLVATYTLVVRPILAITTELGQGASLLAIRSEVVGTSRTAATVGTLISLGITWGFFIYNVISQNISVSDLRFTQALAGTIAETIYILLLACLTLTGVGTVLVGIITVVDLILMAGCYFWDPFWETNGSCWSISGTVTSFITGLIYSSAPMIDMAATNLVVPGSLDLQLANPDLGYIVGNNLTIRLPVTTNIAHKSPYPDGGWHIWAYPWLFSEANLRSSTFSYSLTSPSPASINVDRDQMATAWQGITPIPIGAYNMNMYRGYANADPVPSIVFAGLQAGVNTERPFYLNMGYAIPVYECWTVPVWIGVGLLFVPVCYVRTLSGNNLEESNKPENEAPVVYLDILPATLDGFMEQKVSGNGFALAWDEKFRTLEDADNDGLSLSSNTDPNDGLWDSDGDGLSDLFEVEQSAKGVFFSPEDCDTDDDGLTDRQEVLFGTAPDRKDTDHDGLLDSVEVVHEHYDVETCQPTGIFEGGWQISLNAGSVTVQSDPLRPDTDGDGANDWDEYTWATDPALDASQRVDFNGYPYHPGVKNTPPVWVTGEPDSYTVQPGVVLNYVTTMVTKIALDDSDLAVTLTDFNHNPIGAPLSFSITFPTLEEPITQDSTLTMPSSPYSGLVYITSTLFAREPDGTITPVTSRTAIRVDEEAPSSQIDSLADGQYIRGTDSGEVTWIIGGSAVDSASGIAKVEVSVNSGEWVEASGAEVWTFPLGVGDGAYLIQTRATDGAGNVETPGPGITVYADGNSPTFNFDDPVDQPLVPSRLHTGQWTVPLTGSITDPDITGIPQSGSGVNGVSVLVRMRLSGGEVEAAGDWQAVTITDGLWSLDYRFPPGMTDPTGSWIPEMTASDLVGNTRQEMKPAPSIDIDIAAPVPGLSEEVQARTSMNGSMILDGTITDQISGVDRLDVAFVPYSQVEPLRDTALWLSFEEREDSYFWSDRSGHGNHASCDPDEPSPQEENFQKDCPISNQTEIFLDGRALVFPFGEEPSGIWVFARVPLAFEVDNTATGDGFSVQAWIKSDNPNHGIRIAEQQGIFRLGLEEGGVALDILGYRLSYWGDWPSVIDGAWHHFVGTLDPKAGKVRLFVDGILQDETDVPLDPESLRVSEPLYLGGGEIGQYNGIYYPRGQFSGEMDEVIVFNHALSGAEVQAMYQAPNRKWYPAALAQQGDGITETTWSMELPSEAPDLEGMYQIDLRAYDVLGNSVIKPNAWRGPIDTLAPRLLLNASATNEVYINPTTALRRIGVHYTCSAQDSFLDESTFHCPGANLPPPARSFVQDPILLRMFPNLTLLSGLFSEWTQWQPPGAFSASMSACDLWGNCASETLESSLDTLPNPGPSASVVYPSGGAIIAFDGNLDVSVAASASQLLKEVTLSLDGTVVQTASYAQLEAPTLNEQVMTVTAAEGPHTLVATASDWAGAIQDTLYPVNFILDTTPPEVAISTTEITTEDTYQKGSSILRFNGTASDTLCLSGVKISVNGGPFADTTITAIEETVGVADYTWAVAYYVYAPEGKDLTVTARATDCSGQTSDVTQVITTDLSAPDAPDTRLDSTPGDTSEPDNATFSFTAIPGGREVAVLMCQLDGGTYSACLSPYTLDWLNEGQHILNVRAVDVEGNVDLTPASHTWTVVPKAPPETHVWLPIIY